MIIPYLLIVAHDALRMLLLLLRPEKENTANLSDIDVELGIGALNATK